MPMLGIEMAALAMETIMEESLLVRAAPRDGAVTGKAGTSLISSRAGATAVGVSWREVPAMRSGSESER